MVLSTTMSDYISNKEKKPIVEDELCVQKIKYYLSSVSPLFASSSHHSVH